MFLVGLQITGSFSNDAGKVVSPHYSWFLEFG
jgi:hypothetical protein